MAREHVKVAVAMQDWCPGSYGDGRDEAIDQLANSLPLAPAAAIERGGIVVVGRSRGYQYCPRKQALEAPQLGLVTRPGEYFHPNGIADSDLVL